MTPTEIFTGLGAEDGRSLGERLDAAGRLVPGEMLADDVVRALRNGQCGAFRMALLGSGDVDAAADAARVYATAFASGLTERLGATAAPAIVGTVH